MDGCWDEPREMCLVHVKAPPAVGVRSLKGSLRKIEVFLSE